MRDPKADGCATWTRWYDDARAHARAEHERLNPKPKATDSPAPVLEWSPYVPWKEEGDA